MRGPRTVAVIDLLQAGGYRGPGDLVSEALSEEAKPRGWDQGCKPISGNWDETRSYPHLPGPGLPILGFAGGGASPTLPHPKLGCVGSKAGS